MNHVGVTFNVNAHSGLYADQVRSQLIPSLNDTILRLLPMCCNKLSPEDFSIQPQKEYRGVQKHISTAYFHTLHHQIERYLPNDTYRAWFLSRRESFASLTLNSSVRHVTKKRPPLDSVFPFVLSMRTLRPIFHLFSCGCGEVSDVCGLHLLRCPRASPSPFIKVHNAVRDATVRAFQDYLRRHAPAPLGVFSEVQKFHLCEINRYYPTASSRENHRADAIVFETSDPFHPWFLDFVQAQIDDPAEERVMRNLNTSHQAKISDLVRDHIGIPRQSIIPFAFASNGVFHPSALLFVDWFLCRGSHVPISEPPSIEKLKILHAMCSSISDSTSSLLSEHFSKFISHLHHQSFPFVLSQGAEELAASRRRRKAFAPFGAPGTFDGGSVFARPVAAHSESRINWSFPRPNLAASTPVAADTHDRPMAAPVRRVASVDYRELATVGRRS